MRHQPGRARDSTLNDTHRLKRKKNKHLLFGREYINQKAQTSERVQLMETFYEQIFANAGA